MEIVEARGEALFKRGNKPGRTRRRASANQEDRRRVECGEHTLEFLLQLEAKTDAWILWPNMNENVRSKKNKDNNPLHCWVCGGRLE